MISANRMFCMCSRKKHAAHGRDRNRLETCHDVPITYLHHSVHQRRKSADMRFIAPPVRRGNWFDSNDAQSNEDNGRSARWEGIAFTLRH